MNGVGLGTVGSRTFLRCAGKRHAAKKVLNALSATGILEKNKWFLRSIQG